MTLDEAIRAAVADGRRGITLWYSDQGWQAGVQKPDGAWSIGIDPDPVAALYKALRQPLPATTEGLFE